MVGYGWSLRQRLRRAWESPFSPLPPTPASVKEKANNKPNPSDQHQKILRAKNEFAKLSGHNQKEGEKKATRYYLKQL